MKKKFKKIKMVLAVETAIVAVSTASIEIPILW